MDEIKSDDVQSKSHSKKRERPHKRNPKTVKRKNKERKARRRKLQREFEVDQEGSPDVDLGQEEAEFEEDVTKEMEEEKQIKSKTKKEMFKETVDTRDLKFKFNCLFGSSYQEENSYEARELQKERKRTDRLQVRLHQMKDEFKQMKARHAECIHETQSSVVYARSTLMIENAVFSSTFGLHETVFDEYSVIFHKKSDIVKLSEAKMVLDTSKYRIRHFKSNNFVLKSHKGVSKASSEYRVLVLLNNSSEHAQQIFPKPIAVAVDGENQELVIHFPDFDVCSMTSVKAAIQNRSILQDEWLVILVLMGAIMLVSHDNDIILNSLCFDSLTIGTNKSGNKEPRLLEYWKVCTAQKAKKLTFKQQQQYAEFKFMAPELVSGQRAPSFLSDIFAFGILLRAVNFRRPLTKKLAELSLHCASLAVKDRPTSEEIKDILYQLL